MEENKRRQVLLFTVGTMFAVALVFATWLGWTMSIIRERRAVLDDLRARGATVFAASSEPEVVESRNAWPGLPIPSIPWSQELLGDEAISSIYLFPAWSIS